MHRPKANVSKPQALPPTQASVPVTCCHLASASTASPRAGVACDASACAGVALDVLLRLCVFVSSNSRLISVSAASCAVCGL